MEDVCLKCPRWTAIAEVPPDVLNEEMDRLNNDDVDALVQVGTNMPMARLAATMETRLGTPTIAIKTATYWHALRNNGIDDKISGFGRLLDEL